MLASLSFLGGPVFAAEPLLKIVAPDQTLTLTAVEFAALPRSKLTAADPYTEVPRHFSGVEVRELLTRVGLPFGDKLRGRALQLAVIFRADDGYGVVFALAEFDEAFSHRTLLLADRENDQPLLDNAAPLQLIAPGDKKGARWARMVSSIEIVSLAKP